MKEFRVIGPPGCGKTTYLSTQIKHASESYGVNRVAVCSLTRSAASHVSRRVNIPRENVGTLHSFAYRALPGVEIAEAKAETFNEWCAEQHQPMMKLSGGAGNRGDVDNEDIVDVPAAGETAGDKLQSAMNVARARMIRRQLWPESVRAFAALWDKWKREANLLDFTDLLEIGLRDVSECPTKPAAWFVDESQDLSRLAFALARKWGERCLRFVNVGDPDQILYDWAGVDVGAFYRSDLPPEQTRTLRQSYRVPGEVLALAVKWINETPGRRPVEYAPRRVNPEDRTSAIVPGKVSRCSATTQVPRNAIQDAKRRIADGKTVLFLVSCSYMLTKVIAELRNAGVPFHCPYRVTRGDWNPLRIGGASPASRIASFLKMDVEGETVGWTNKDVARFTEWLSSRDHLTYGARTAIDEAAKERPDEPASLDLVLSYVKQGYWEHFAPPDLDWWAGAIDKKHRPRIEYPLAVYKAKGYAGLTTVPQATVATIHAAKGGEADIVYLFPDLSPQAHSAWMGRGDGKEGVRRAFYVALTRAREELVLCNASSNLAVRL